MADDDGIQEFIDSLTRGSYLFDITIPSVAEENYRAQTEAIALHLWYERGGRGWVFPPNYDAAEYGEELRRRLAKADASLVINDLGGAWYQIVWISTEWGDDCHEHVTLDGTTYCAGSIVWTQDSDIPPNRCALLPEYKVNAP